MKVKTKLCAAVLAIALGCGVLAGCQTGTNSGSKGGNASTSQNDQTKYLVNVSQSADYTVAGLEADGYLAGAKVTFTVTPANGKEIVSVGYDQTDLTAKADGSYEFDMPSKNVTLIVTVRTIEQYALSHSGTVQVGGDPVTFTLKLGTDPVASFDLVAVEGAEHVTISGHNVTGVSAGSVTVAAKVNNEEKARETFTVEKGAERTIAEAIADAWAKDAALRDNNKSGNTAKSSDQYIIKGKILALSNVYNGTLSMVIDDGTETIYLQCLKVDNPNPFNAKVGDVVKVKTYISNHYGLIEASGYPDTIEIINEAITPKTTYPEVNNSNYDATIDKLTTAVSAGPRKLVPASFTAKTNDSDPEKDNRFNVDGVTSTKYNNGFIATSSTGFELYQVHDASYEFTGFFYTWNSESGKKYANFLPVSQAKLAATAVSIDGDENINMTLTGAQSTKQLTFTTTPVDAGKQVSWSVNPTGVVSVEDGLLTAQAAGSAVVKVTVDGKEDTVNVTVGDALKPATAVALNPTSIEMEKGEEEDLVATITPADATDAPIWSVVPATGVVTLEPDASNAAKVTVKGVAAGDAVITVKLNDDVSATCNVKVNPIHGTVETDPLTAEEAYTIGRALAGANNKSVYTEEEYYVKDVLTAYSAPADGKVSVDKAIGDKIGLYNTQISNEVAATFEKGSIVTAHGQICNYSNGYKIQFAGQASVVAADNTKASIVNISGDTTVAAGSTITLTANVFPASLNAVATFTSENEDIATVTSAGVVTGVAAGSATIKAQSGDAFSTYLVTVTSASAVTVTKTTNELATENSWTVSTQGNEVCYTSFNLDTNIAISTTGSANCGSVWGTTNKDWRLYQNKSGNLIITAATGFKLTAATFVFTNSNDGILKLSDATVVSGTPIELSGSSATFVVGNSGSKTNGQIRITSFSVTYEAL